MGSKITIRYGGTVYGGAGEMAFYVSDDAVLTSGTETISLSDVDQGDESPSGDEVRIEYYRKSFAGFYVRRLEDANRLNHAV